MDEVAALSQVARTQLQMLWSSITVPVGVIFALLLGVGESLLLSEGGVCRYLGRKLFTVIHAFATLGGVLCLAAIRVTWNLAETVVPLAPALVLSVLVLIQFAAYYANRAGKNGAIL